MEELKKGYEFTKAQIAELESLRAWKAEIEKQEPVAWEITVGKWIGGDRYINDTSLSKYHRPGAKPLFAAPVVSPNVEKLIADHNSDMAACHEQFMDVSREVMSLKTELEAARRQQFTAAVVYSAAQIIQAHDEPTIAEDLLNTVIKPTDDLTGCAEYDLAILRKAIPAWANVKEGE